MFPVIQKEFLKKQVKRSGSDHIYGADPFNEIQSPSWEPDYLATVFAYDLQYDYGGG
ncbi:MAG: alpha-N-acetylglucosaminidase TIM-barrel domain-containing protein [Odoribacter sp.]